MSINGGGVMSEQANTSQCKLCPLSMMAGYRTYCSESKCELWDKACLIKTCLREIIHEKIRTRDLEV